MRHDANLRRKLFLKIKDAKPNLSVSNTNDLLNRLFDCDDIFVPNVLEWLENKTISDIWINEKYCINAVMQIRGNNDFISAIIAIDDYLKDESKEYALWQPRA